MATITAGVLCDFAQVREQLLFVSSAGLTRLHRSTVPAPLGVMLALMVQVPPDEHAIAHELTVVVKRNDTAEDVARSVTGLQIGSNDAFPGESIQVPVVVNMHGVTVEAFGAYDVRMSIDDEDGPLLTCYVVEFET